MTIPANDFYFKSAPTTFQVSDSVADVGDVIFKRTGVAQVLRDSNSSPAAVFQDGERESEAVL
jgi:hypothetical protein